ncbi:MAG: carbohydrate ABC transporter permease, partial [Omnitrophica WOR_2 bacterium]
ITVGKEALAISSTPRYFMNSVIIAGCSTLLALIFGTLSAYAFSRFEVPGKSDILFFILSQKFLPPVVVIIPIFMMYRFLGWIDSYKGMILLYTSFNLPFVVWMVKGFMDDIPVDYEEAALVDGYTRFQAFFRITLPQALPGLAATAVFCLITVWNEYVFSAILTGDRAKTAPVAIASSIGTQMTDWGIVAALTTIFVIPVIIFTLLVRNYLLRGVTFGVIRR